MERRTVKTFILLALAAMSLVGCSHSSASPAETTQGQAPGREIPGMVMEQTPDSAGSLPPATAAWSNRCVACVDLAGSPEKGSRSLFQARIRWHFGKLTLYAVFEYR
jgi:hypothetical protein